MMQHVLHFFNEGVITIYMKTIQFFSIFGLLGQGNNCIDQSKYIPIQQSET